jgi:hypothetical protein
MTPNPQRAGKYVGQVGGYAAFCPAPLPPDPAIQVDDCLATKLANASRSLGRLDGATEMRQRNALPDEY